MLQVLGNDHVIQCLEKCDFMPMYEHFMAEREAKKALSKEVCGGCAVSSAIGQQRRGKKTMKHRAAAELTLQVSRMFCKHRPVQIAVELDCKYLAT